MTVPTNSQTPEQTNALIAALALDTKPIAAGARLQRLFGALGIGVLLTIAALLLMLSVRYDLATAMWAMNYWLKTSYTAALAGCGLVGVYQLGRPEAPAPHLRWVLLTIAVLAGAALVTLLRTPSAGWPALMWGGSASVCSRYIALLSVPLFGVLMFAMRGFAPTRLRMAGAAVGLAAGAGAATIYGLHCPETSMLFVLIWYSLGIAIATVVGALSGPYLLRW